MITAAAIRSGNKVWTGRRHGDCFLERAKEGNPGLKPEQGFVTDTGQFLNRAEAYEYAIKCGQIQDRGKTRILVSEDLW